jgi:hypothetical protein
MATANDVQLRFDYNALDKETRVFALDRTEHIHNLAPFGHRS